jgi:tetratricopeptide (TPR) repeat protein
MKKFTLLFLTLLATTGCSKVGEILNTKGALAYNQNHLETANRYFHWATLLDADNAAAWNNAGYVLYLTKAYDLSEKAFQTALNRAKEEKLVRQIKLDQALLYCDPQAILGPPPHGDWNRKGTGLFESLVQGDPDNAELHMRLGFAYFRGTNPGGGFSELDKAVQMATPRQVSHYTNDSVNGALLILRQIQRFYVTIRYFKKAHEVKNKISKLEKIQSNSPGHP